MQQDIQTRMIDGCEYRVRYLTPTKVLQYVPFLSQLLGPSLGRLFDSLMKGNGFEALIQQDISELSITDAVEQLTAKLDDPRVQALIDDLKKCTEYSEDGGKSWPELSRSFDVHFQGKTFQMFKWIKFAFEVQFADFFGGLRSEVSAAIKSQMATNQASQSQSTFNQPGQSGD